jgi:hypothetical protein
MSTVRSRSTEAAQRFAERRKREDEAPRLAREVPRLKTLRLDIEERRTTAAGAESKHVRHVVVDRAPALFLLPCGDPDCRMGGHDLTRAVMHELASGATLFDIEEACRGTVGNAECTRIIHVAGVATYA